MNIGRHTNDHMFSFYVASPVGVLTEFGAGGCLIDDSDLGALADARTRHLGPQARPLIRVRFHALRHS